MCFDCKNLNSNSITEEVIQQIIDSTKIIQMSCQEFAEIMNYLSDKILESEDPISKLILIEDQEKNSNQTKARASSLLFFRERANALSCSNDSTELLQPKIKAKTNTNILNLDLNYNHSNVQTSKKLSNFKAKYNPNQRKLTINFSSIKLTNSNLKTYLSFYIQEHFMDSSSVWSSFHSALLTDMNKANFNNYKLLVMSWAIGYLTDPHNQANQGRSQKAIFFELLLQVYDKGISLKNINEFLKAHVISSTIVLNDCVSKVFKSKFSTLVNGMFVNVELLQSFDRLNSEIFTLKTIDLVTEKLQSLVIEKRLQNDSPAPKTFTVENEELFNTLICTKSLRKYICESFQNRFNFI